MIEDLLLQLINRACRLERTQARAREQLFEVRPVANAPFPVFYHLSKSVFNNTSWVQHAQLLLM